MAPSDMVLKINPNTAGYNSSVDFPKECFKSVAKKIPNSVGARTRPCYMPLRKLKRSEVAPSYKTVSFMPL